jgi:hypothetical protein
MTSALSFPRYFARFSRRRRARADSDLAPTVDRCLKSVFRHPSEHVFLSPLGAPQTTHADADATDIADALHSPLQNFRISNFDGAPTIAFPHVAHGLLACLRCISSTALLRATEHASEHVTTPDGLPGIGASQTTHLLFARSLPALAQA